jgi:hypothetical protein
MMNQLLKSIKLHNADGIKFVLFMNESNNQGVINEEIKEQIHFGDVFTSFTTESFFFCFVFFSCLKRKD